MNTVPETTGAAISVARAIPELKGKFDGLSFRVPNITGSISDITFIAKRATTVEETRRSSPTPPRRRAGRGSCR